VAKPSFSTADLLDERFDFDRIALSRLRRKAGEAEAHGDIPVEAARERFQ